MADPFFAPLNPYQVRQLEQGRAVEEAGGGPFARMAIGAGYAIGQRLGYQSADEQRAGAASQILGAAELEVTEDDPLERRYQVLRHAARKFNEAGMVDYVQQIMPEVLHLQRQRIEQAKLKAEADETVASTRAKDIQTDFDELSFVARLAKAQADARAAGTDYQPWYNRDLGRFRTVNAKDPETTAQAAREGYIPLSVNLADLSEEALGTKTKSDISQQVVDFEESANASALAAGHLSDALRLVQSNPNAPTWAGAVSTVAAKLGQNALAAFKANNVDIGTTVEGNPVAAEVAKSLPRASAQLRGMVVNLIYAQARVNDPGGRLSNQDVQVLAQQFDPNNPQTLADTLNRMIHQNWRDTQIRARGLGITDAAGAMVQPNTAFQGAKEAYENAVKLTAPATTLDLSKLTDEQLLERLRSGR